VLSHHDGNTALTDHRNLLHYFLFKTSDLGNTPFRFDPYLRPYLRPIFAPAAGSQQSLKPVHYSFVADVYRDDGKRFVVRADEKLTAFYGNLKRRIGLTRRRDFSKLGVAKRI